MTGTNAMALAMPADPFTFSYDASTTVVPRGKLEVFRKNLDNISLMGGGRIDSGLVIPSVSEQGVQSVSRHDMILYNPDDKIFANSALSEFIAINLVAANEIIDLKKFPESADWDNLLDAFFEAMYQNPLALHVESLYSIPEESLLIVEYKESIEKIHNQQEALRNIAPRIVSEIVNNEMTNLEMCFAINDYLIKNSEYDWLALEDGERNNYQKVDAKFNDSFTAYGILINKVGVCAGYADAFKLLADEAGLDSIIVTGYMEGVLPHAWNRVYIEGQWHTVDVTNNANEYLFNAFLNLPDSAAGMLLVEDNQFIMNKFISKYRSNNSVSEYYTVMGKFFEPSDVAEELARQLQEKGNVTLRTDFDLDDERFYEIALDVMETLNVVELYGFHMLGVIWMEIAID